MRKTIHWLFLSQLVIALLCFSANAQSLELPNVTRQGFKGLRKMNEAGYYVQFIEGSQDGSMNAKVKMHLYTLSNDLAVVSDFTLDLTPTEAVEDVAFNGGNFLVIIGSKTAKTRTLKIVDTKGAVLANKEFKDLNVRLFSKPAVALPVGTNDFIVINYVKEKKVGYSVDRYTSNLDQVFSKTTIPDKKKLYPVDYVVSGDNLYVLEYLDADMNDTFEYTITAYNINSGESSQPVALISADSKAYGFATFIRPGLKGGVVTGGMYFNGPRTQESNSDGFFAATITSDNTLRFSYVDWKDAASQLKDKSTAAMWGGKTKTFMHDLWVNADGSITLIGENYRRGDADLAGEKSKSALAIAGKIGKVAGQGGDS